MRPKMLVRSLAKCNDSSACALENPDLPLEPRPKGVPLCLEIEAGLRIEPKPVRGAEIPRQPEGRIRRDGAGPMHDLIDPSGRYRDIVHQAAPGKGQRLQKPPGAPRLGELTLVWAPSASPCAASSVMVDELDVVRISVRLSEDAKWLEEFVE